MERVGKALSLVVMVGWSFAVAVSAPDASPRPRPSTPPVCFAAKGCPSPKAAICFAVSGDAKRPCPAATPEYRFAPRRSG